MHKEVSIVLRTAECSFPHNLVILYTKIAIPCFELLTTKVSVAEPLDSRARDELDEPHYVLIDVIPDCRDCRSQTRCQYVLISC